jgi:hypothetical protein
MGLIAKSATKKRVQPMSGPVNGALGGTPWLTNGGIPAGALIRSAVLALDLTGTRSSSLRGRQHVLASLVVPAFASHLWVETNDFRTWEFVLGIDNGREAIAADWVIRLSVTPDTATVQTLRWLTKDDALVHGPQHDALRQELLRGLATGEQAEARGEDELGAASFKVALPFPAPPPEPGSVAFSLVTPLDEGTVRKRLALLGYRVLDDSPSGLRWGLGLPQYQEADHVAITFGAGALAGVASLGSLAGPGRRIAVQALRNFIDRALFLIRQADESVSYEGPGEWKP